MSFFSKIGKRFKNFFKDPIKAVLTIVAVVVIAIVAPYALPALGVTGVTFSTALLYVAAFATVAIAADSKWMMTAFWVAAAFSALYLVWFAPTLAQMPKWAMTFAGYFTAAAEAGLVAQVATSAAIALITTSAIKSDTSGASLVEEASKSVTSVVSTVASAAVSIAGAVVSGVGKAITSSPLLWAAIGVGAIILLSGSGKDEGGNVAMYRAPSRDNDASDSNLGPSSALVGSIS